MFLFSETSQNHKLSATLAKAHSSTVRALVVDDEGRVWSADVSGTVVVWNTNTLRVSAVFVQRDGSAILISFLDGSETEASGGGSDLHVSCKQGYVDWNPKVNCYS